ncbi:MAG: DNA polymerase III subunit alpha [Thermoguttaceae bacterium]
MDIPFVHLHCHSHFSILDGAAKPATLLERAKTLEMPALALTDHGTLGGILEFYQEAKKIGIKPILGLEAYMSHENRFDKSKRPFHLTLLAMNRVGYKNLLKLSSASYTEGFYFKPRIDRELLERWHEGIICLSGCASSEFSQAILQGESDSMTKARETAQWFRNLFGDRYYLEIQDNGLEIQKDILECAVQIGKEFDIPTVATNDVHYIYKEDCDAQDILLCVNTGKLRSDEKRMRMDSDQFFLRSGREMLRVMPAHEDSIRRTVEIANRIDCELELGKRFFPGFTPPDGLTSDDYLRKLCIEGLKRRYEGNTKRLINGELSEEVMARLDRELSVIAKMGYPNYFLIVWDFVRVAEERGIHRTARGSGVGALVCYALNMSHVCPLEFDLLFERFLDENRVEAPDIDIDFDQERRGEILDYVKEKYGEMNVAQISTLGTLAAKQSIKDVGRVLNMAISAVESITKLVPDTPKMKIKKALEENAELQKRYETETEVKELIDIAKKLEGLNRQSGVHACAVVIADQPLTEYLPLQTDKEGTGIVTQWQMGDVEKAGLLKMDFLGLRNLSILAAAIELIRQTTGKTIDPYRFPLDDVETFQLFSCGETKGVFQFESGGIRELLQRMKPDSFRDIIATAALYRPGPLEGGMVSQYVEVKHGRKKAEYIHPVMKEVLEETNGVMVYQEQIMRILNRLGKIPLGDAYSCIKAISKKKEEMIGKYRSQFIEGSKENGLSESDAENLFELIIKFAGYGFNKSHSTAYALVAYMTAYLKAHYPVEFMAALLCGDIDKRNFKSKDSTVEHIEDCVRIGIEIIYPDVNISSPLYSVVDGKIAFALTAIKGCGASAAAAIEASRNEKGPFKNLFDFCERVDQKACSRSTMEILIKAGAMDSFGMARSQMLALLDLAFKSAQSTAEDRARGQKNFLEDMDDEPISTSASSADSASSASSLSLPAGTPIIPEWDDKEKATYEKEVLGFYRSAHPLTELEKTFKQFRTHSCYDAVRRPDRDEVVVAGMIGEIKLTNTKNPKPGKPSVYANLTIEDAQSTIRSIIWPEQYAKFQPLVYNESIVFAAGRIDRSRSQNEDDANLIINELLSIEEAAEKWTRGWSIILDEAIHSPEQVRCLQEMLQKHPGTFVVDLSTRLKSGTVATFLSNIRIKAEQELWHKIGNLLGYESLKVLLKQQIVPANTYKNKWKKKV